MGTGGLGESCRPASRTLSRLLPPSGQVPSPRGDPAVCHSGLQMGPPAGTSWTSALEAGTLDSTPKPVLAGAWRTTSAPALLGTPVFFPSPLLLQAALHPVTPANFPTPVAGPVAQHSHPSFWPSSLGPVSPGPGCPRLHAGTTALEDPARPVLLPLNESQAAVACWLFLFPADPIWTDCKIQNVSVACTFPRVPGGSSRPSQERF